MDVRDLPKVVLSRSCQRLAEAWGEWRGSRLLPRKADMNLAHLTEYLPWLGLLEVVDPDLARLRVAGTSLRDIYGLEMTGRNMKEITAPADWPKRSARFAAQVGRPAGSYYFRRDTLPDGKIVSYETVALPVEADAEGRVRHMLYVVAPLQQWYALEQPAGPRILPMPTAFHFIDIGAGHPDAP